MTNFRIGKGDARPHVSELVINWHFTEACNYKCRYCYAKWQGDEREVLHDWRRTRVMLDELTLFFRPDNASNPLSQSLTWSGIRLNLAGGEPLLYPEAALRVLAHAKASGMATSIITNGSRLTQQLVAQLAPLVSMVGISIDSSDAAVNEAIGRIDGRGALLDVKEMAALLGFARQVNPDLTFKINTVVNSLNAHEDLGAAIAALAPNRWKVLRMLPVVTGDLAVSAEDFKAFVQRHASHSDVMCVEDNEDMSESYLMIDPLGRFFQNTKGKQGYSYSRPVDQVGANLAFRDWRFSVSSFASRYRADSKESGT
ncbi:viperin family antiviral radical SAM protein [Aquabacterium sp.]|uniref:viperin family antiviral radical SAM protein n=1 Tax=Aquabacterium sp. TaxID=1872578 RepID=UPI003BB096C2